MAPRRGVGNCYRREGGLTRVTVHEYAASLAPRYRTGRRAEKGRILDEFCATTGMHRGGGVGRGGRPPFFAVGRGGGARLWRGGRPPGGRQPLRTSPAAPSLKSQV